MCLFFGNPRLATASASVVEVYRQTFVGLVSGRAFVAASRAHRARTVAARLFRKRLRLARLGFMGRQGQDGSGECEQEMTARHKSLPRASIQNSQRSARIGPSNRKSMSRTM